jgi:chromosome partitioning protein
MSMKEKRVGMTRTLVVANQKGGIGKSTAVANLGRALTEKGCRVLLIDLDPQGGLSACFGIDSYHVQRSSYSLLMYDNVAIGRVVQNVGQNLALLPASKDLISAEVQLASRNDQVLRLRQALARNRLTVDFILIDTPPTLSILTANALAAAGEALIPVQCQYLAMRGVRATLDTLQRIQQNLNPDLKLTGIFATMYQPDSLHAQEALEELRAVFGETMFQTVLAMADIIAEAPVAGIPLLDYAPDHPLSYAYRALAQEIMNRGAQAS